MRPGPTPRKNRTNQEDGRREVRKTSTRAGDRAPEQQDTRSGISTAGHETSIETATKGRQEPTWRPRTRGRPSGCCKHLKAEASPPWKRGRNRSPGTGCLVTTRSSTLSTPSTLERGRSRSPGKTHGDHCVVTPPSLRRSNKAGAKSTRTTPSLCRTRMKPGPIPRNSLNVQRQPRHRPCTTTRPGSEPRNDQVLLA